MGAGPPNYQQGIPHKDSSYWVDRFYKVETANTYYLKDSLAEFLRMQTSYIS